MARPGHAPCAPAFSRSASRRTGVRPKNTVWTLLPSTPPWPTTRCCRRAARASSTWPFARRRCCATSGCSRPAATCRNAPRRAASAGQTLPPPPAALPQPPETRRLRWEDALAAADAPGASGRLLDQVFYRVERQTTLPLPVLQRGVFFIRVMVCPLTEALGVGPGRAAQLAEALASMSEAVVAYRGMGAVRERLCAELGAIGS